MKERIYHSISDEDKEKIVASIVKRIGEDEWDSLDGYEQAAVIVFAEDHADEFDECEDADDVRSIVFDNHSVTCTKNGFWLADCAEELLDETGALDEIPEHWRSYFDYEAFARDWQYDLCAHAAISYGDFYGYIAIQ